MKGAKAIALLWLSTAFSVPGHAAEFNVVQAEKSTLAFTFRQMNVAQHGQFRNFVARLDFDPDNVASASVSLDVGLASIDTGTPEGDSEVAGKQWFNTRAFPVAHFASNGVKPLGGNRYEVTGQLSLKGRTQAVSAPTTVTLQGDRAVFDGSFVLKRADFAIGEGPWADVDVIANEVQITFHVIASSTK